MVRRLTRHRLFSHASYVSYNWQAEALGLLKMSTTRTECKRLW
jgi:hypothetical protein